MNKRRARKLIRELQREVDPLVVQQQFWLDKVQAYVQLIFGDSNKSIALPMFGTYYNDRYYNNPGDHSEKANNVTERLSELFKTYQQMIDNSVFLHRNIFSNDSNGTVAAWAIFVVGLISSAAFILGKRSADIEFVEHKHQIEILQDSVETLKNRINSQVQSVDNYLNTKNTKDSKDYFIIGSTEEKVIEVMGEPTTYLRTAPEASKFHYGLSTVYFYKGKVISYDNLDKNLKVKIR